MRFYWETFVFSNRSLLKKLLTHRFNIFRNFAFLRNIYSPVKHWFSCGKESACNLEHVLLLLENAYCKLQALRSKEYIWSQEGYRIYHFFHAIDSKFSCYKIERERYSISFFTLYFSVCIVTLALYDTRFL